MNIETLEDAKIRIYKDHWNIEHTQSIKSNFLNGFEQGAKWQTERSYSDEEVMDMFDTLKRNSIDNVATITNVDLFISSWKREFKKK
jgi:hypothetical protein